MMSEWSDTLEGMARGSLFIATLVHLHRRIATNLVLLLLDDRYTSEKLLIYLKQLLMA